MGIRLKTTGRDDGTAKSRPRILVVDDEKDIRQLLVDCLSDDFEISEAPNGNEAL
jgi:CheY-like chemotaxis protein